MYVCMYVYYYYYYSVSIFTITSITTTIITITITITTIITTIQYYNTIIVKDGQAYPKRFLPELNKTQ